MKFFAVFAAVLAVSAAAPTTQWTLDDLSNAIQSPATPASYLPYLEQALNTMMEELFAGKPVDSIAVITPIGVLPVEAVVAPSPASVMPGGIIAPSPVNPAPVVEPTPAAVVADASGSPLVQIIVNINQESAVAEAPATVAAPSPAPAPVIVVEEAELPSPVIVVEEAAPTTQWTLDDLSNAIQSPATPASYLPYLEQALNTMMEELFAGKPVDSIAVITPIGVLPVEAIITPSPASVMPGGIIDPAPVGPSPVSVMPGAPENPIDVVAISAPELNPIDLLAPVPVAIAAGATQEGILV